MDNDPAAPRLLGTTQHPQEGFRRDDRDPFIYTQRQQVIIARHHMRSAGRDGTRQDHIIIRVAHEP